MAETVEARDPHIGERYVDLDPRHPGRYIRVIGFKDDPNTPGDESGQKFWPKVVTTFSWVRRPKYRYEVLANASNPRQIGRRGTISAKTLDNPRRYMKVSH